MRVSFFPGSGCAFVVLIVLLIATAHAQVAGPAAPPGPAAQNAGTGGENPPAAAEKPSYVLRPGDEVEIRVYNVPQLNQTVRVRPDGRVSLLLLDDLDVAGVTPEELGRRLSALYAKHEFRDPKVTAIVRSFSGHSVFVGGQVLQPGQVPMSGDLTAVTAVFRAGGFRDEASLKNVVLLRDGGDGTPVTIPLNLEEVLQKSKPDTRLRAGDVIYVPKSTISVYVGGEVVEPGLVPLDGTLTALAAVVKAKGFRPTAKAGSVILLRNSGQGGPQITKINLEDVVEKGKPDLPLQPFDVVYVPKSKIAKIDQFMEHYFRQVLPVSMNVGFSYLLGAKVF